MNSAAPSRGRLTARCLSVLLSFPYFAAGTDWPQYRGPNHDGTCTDRIIRQWTGSVTNAVWIVPLTNCLGSLAVSGSRVFTQTRRLLAGVSTEFCTALNASNGVELWSTPLGLASYPSGGVGFDDGPRSTPAVDGGSVFVLSSYLRLFKLNATNGAILWTNDLRTNFNATLIAYENCASPVIENGLIYLNANCATNTLMALRIADGSVAWRVQNEGLTHATPTLTTIQGVRQIIFATQSGLVSVDCITGSRLWKFNYPFNYSTSLGVSPVVCNDMIFTCGAQAYGMGSFAARVTLSNGVWSATQLWANLGVASTLSSHWMTPVCYQGFLYGPFGVQSFDSPSAQLKCVDLRTGAVKWSVNGFGRGASVVVNTQLVTITEQGFLVLSDLSTNTYVERGRFRAIPNWNSSTNKCWNVPAVADGRVYVRSTSFVAAYDLSVPNLQIDLPQSTAPGQIQLTVRTVSGTPITSNRLTGMEARAATNITQILTQWSRLTNELVLTNGVVRINNIDSATQPQRFFIIDETN